MPGRTSRHNALTFFTGGSMLRRVLPFIVLVFAVGFPKAYAQKDSGKPFGSRDARTCDSRKAPTRGGLSAEQAKQYLICDKEKVSISIAYGQQITLITDVKVETARPRAFRMDFDSYGFTVANQIDPAQPVVPIQGSFTEYSCANLRPGPHTRGDLTTPGKNCWILTQRDAKGTCFKSAFGDWHCYMQGGDSSTWNRDGSPPPTGF